MSTFTVRTRRQDEEEDLEPLKRFVSHHNLDRIQQWMHRVKWRRMRHWHVNCSGKRSMGSKPHLFFRQAERAPQMLARHG